MLHLPFSVVCLQLVIRPHQLRNSRLQAPQRGQAANISQQQVLLVQQANQQQRAAVICLVRSPSLKCPRLFSSQGVMRGQLVQRRLAQGC